MNQFNNVIGHKKVLEYLIGDINNGNLSHAYLFSGPSNIGKFLVAKQFALTIKNTDKFINDIYIINEVPIESKKSGQLKDTNIYLKDRKTNSIVVEDIHEIINIVSKTSFTGLKVVLIKNIERISANTSGTLLKAVEEPPSDNTIFIFTTDLINSIPKTLVSRCRLIQFSNVPKEESILGISKLGYDKENLIKLIDIASDAPGTILDLLKDSVLLENYLRISDKVKKLLIRKDNLVERFSFVEEISKSDEDTKILINIIHYYLYKRFHEDAKGKDDLKETNNMINFIEKCRSNLRIKVNQRLILENIMLLV